MRRLGFVLIAVTLAATGCASKKTATAPTVRPPRLSPDALKPPPVNTGVDISGKWAGKWFGYGIVDIPRNEDATAELIQRGSHGYGRLVFEGTDAAESVPISLRRGGLTGARVQFDVSGKSVTMKHELGGNAFAIDFKVDGDQMVGHVRNTDTPVRGGPRACSAASGPDSGCSGTPENPGAPGGRAACRRAARPDTSRAADAQRLRGDS
jgi:hypothetical protein